MKDLIVITGGPGTGKTYTVLNIITALKKANPKDNYRIALAAPTGKASRRLSESIESGKSMLDDPVELPEEAYTVHKLLGADYHASSFTYNEQNKLPYDLIILDEASMLDINMWVRLIRAIPDNAKLVVLGDKDQLASVEAGSILGDICQGENSFNRTIAEKLSQVLGMEVPESKDSLPAINDSIVFLTKSYRFDEHSGIKKLSEAINRSDVSKVMEVLEHPEYPDIRFLPLSADNMDRLMDEYVVRHYKEYAGLKKEQKLAGSNERKILCALRVGTYGVEKINFVSERRIKSRVLNGVSGEWYPDRIIMSQRNNPVLKLRNGEIGISKEEDEYRVYFEGESQIPVSAGRLSFYEPAYALTIHKSQGSEFNHVAVVLPDQVNPVLSKELLYTSVTRARQSVLVIGSPQVIQAAVKKSVSRDSGLKDRIWLNHPETSH